MLNSAWGFEEDLNRLKWWTLCTPLVKPVRGDWRATDMCALARLDKPGRERGRGCGTAWPICVCGLARPGGAVRGSARCDVMCWDEMRMFFMMTGEFSHRDVL